MTIVEDYVEGDSVSAVFPSDPTQPNFEFKGWFDTSAQAGGNEYTEYKGTEDITLYARWKAENSGGSSSEDLLCRRATVLYEVGFCPDHLDYCNTSEKLYYGNLSNSDTLQPGDALDCDINGDGEYHIEENGSYPDRADERFYYVSDYYDTATRTFNSSYATLIASNNYPANTDTTMTAYTKWIDGTSSAYEGPKGLWDFTYHFPSDDDWSNVSLLNSRRYILSATADLDAPIAFDYTGYNARFLTIPEIESACGVTINSTETQYLPASCRFLWADISTTPEWYWVSGAYWLETISDGNTGFIMSSGYIATDGTGYQRNVRPVIDVAKNRIEGIKVTYTVTYPDGTTEEVDAGLTYALRTNKSTKEDANGAAVTFDNNDSTGAKTVKHTTKSYVANGWTIDGTHYDDTQIITVTSDITVEYDYIETVTGVEFPSNPERVGYTFNGWFDDKTGGTEVTSYDGDEDTTLYAHWTVVTGPIVLPVNDTTKENANYVVTFKYNNGSDDTTSNVVVNHLEKNLHT